MARLARSVPVTQFPACIRTTDHRVSRRASAAPALSSGWEPIIARNAHSARPNVELLLLTLGGFNVTTVSAVLVNLDFSRHLLFYGLPRTQSLTSGDREEFFQTLETLCRPYSITHSDVVDNSSQICFE